MSYSLPALANYPLICQAFSTTADGNMSFLWGEKNSVADNRRKFLEHLKLNSSKVISAELQNSDTVLRVGRGDAGYGVLQNDYKLKADGLITNEPDLYLWHMVGDCLSVLIYDPAHQAIGLVHAGWQGINLNIIAKTINLMNAQFNTSATTLIIGLGPGIRQCCYVYTKHPLMALPSWRPYLTLLPSGLTAINLTARLGDQLMQAGVKPTNIFDSGLCTAHDNNFFSHYRDQRLNQPDQGRFATLIGLKY